MKSMDNTTLCTTFNSVIANFGSSVITYDAKRDKVILNSSLHSLVTEKFILDLINSMLLTCFYKSEFSNYIFEQVKSNDEDMVLNLYDYNTGYNGFRTFEFEFSDHVRLLKNKKSQF